MMRKQKLLGENVSVLEPSITALKTKSKKLTLPVKCDTSSGKLFLAVWPLVKVWPRSFGN